MDKIKKNIFDRITLVWALVATGAFIVMYIVINFSPIGVSGLLKITDGTGILDLELLGYSSEKAYNMLTLMGTEGRNFYNFTILPLDFFFPITYMLMYSFWIIYALKKLNAKKVLYLLLLIPILTMLFDWSENICILVMLHNYPTVMKTVCSIASFFTVIKSIFTLLSIFTMTLLLILFLIKFFKLRKTQKASAAN
ncbi:MAG: hypothetical protein FWG51_03030 [Firmicutes bacterium]|nr:hypothetical protein [Bacillota bacterium]